MNHQDKSFLVTLATVMGAMLLIAVTIFLTARLVSNASIVESEEGLMQAAIAKRLAPIGAVSLVGEEPPPGEMVAAADTASAGVPGEAVYNRVCAACHTAGVLNAPKYGSKEDWEPRYAQGIDTLVTHAVNGINAMPAKGGDPNLSEQDIHDSIVYILANSGIDVPGAPSAEAPAAEAPAASAEAPAAEAAPAAAAPAADFTVDLAKGEQVYNSACFACHGTGAAGAPMMGDKAAWESRAEKGMETLVSHAVNGFNAMPAKGGNAALSDGDVHNAVAYIMAQTGIEMAAAPAAAEAPSAEAQPADPAASAAAAAAAQASEAPAAESESSEPLPQQQAGAIARPTQADEIDTNPGDDSDAEAEAPTAGTGTSAPAGDAAAPATESAAPMTDTTASTPETAAAPADLQQAVNEALEASERAAAAAQAAASAAQEAAAAAQRAASGSSAEAASAPESEAAAAPAAANSDMSGESSSGESQPTTATEVLDEATTDQAEQAVPQTDQPSLDADAPQGSAQQPILQETEADSDADTAEPTSEADAQQDTTMAAGGVVPASVDLARGKQLYNTACIICHDAGVAGAPKMGDQAAWQPRIDQGFEVMVDHAINGYKGMPAKGGRVDLPDQEIRDAVGFMVDSVQQ